MRVAMVGEVDEAEDWRAGAVEGSSGGERVEGSGWRRESERMWTHTGAEAEKGDGESESA